MFQGIVNQIYRTSKARILPLILLPISWAWKGTFCCEPKLWHSARNTPSLSSQKTTGPNCCQEHFFFFFFLKEWEKVWHLHFKLSMDQKMLRFWKQLNGSQEKSILRGKFSSGGCDLSAWVHTKSMDRCLEVLSHLFSLLL